MSFKGRKVCLGMGVVVLVLTLCGGMGTARGAVLFSDDFNSYANGSQLAGQGGWTLASGVGTVVDTTSTGWASGNHPSTAGGYIRPDVSGGGTSPVTSVVSHSLSLSNGVATFDWFAATRYRGDDMARLILVNSADTSKSIDFGFTTDVNIRFVISNFSSTYTADGYAGTWYEFKMVLDLVTNTVSAYCRPDFGGHPQFDALAENVALPAGFASSEVRFLTMVNPSRWGIDGAGIIDDLVVDFVAGPTPTPTPTPNVIFSDNFSSYANGSQLDGQGGWTLDPGFSGGVGMVVDTASTGWASGSHPSVAGGYIHPDPSGGGLVASRVQHSLSVAPQSGVATFDWYAATDSRGDDMSRFGVYDDGAPTMLYVEFGFVMGGGDNNIRLATNVGSPGTVFATGYAATWYEFRLEFDLVNHTLRALYRPDFSGTPNFTLLDTRALPSGFGIDRITVQAQMQATYNGKGLFDDLVVTFVPSDLPPNLIPNPDAEFGVTDGWITNSYMALSNTRHGGVWAFDSWDNEVDRWTLTRLTTGITVDKTKVYKLDAYYNLYYNTGSYAGGTPEFAVQQGNHVLGDLGTTAFILDYDTSGYDVWTYWSKTIGPAGSGCDLEWYPNAESFMFIVEPGGESYGIGRILWDDMSFSVLAEYKLLQVTPGSQDVGFQSGTTHLDVSNGGSVSMDWTAEVISGGDWLTISSGASGTNGGTINLSFTGNADLNNSRTATVRVTSLDTYGSPKDVTVVQMAHKGLTPQGSVVIDGDLSDWPAAGAWSGAFVFWNGSGLTSTTKARFAWNDAQDMLYVAVQTNETSQQPGGHLVIGPGKDIGGVPTSGMGTTQLCFDPVPGGNDVTIRNEIDYYTVKFSYGWPRAGIEGVEAKYSVSGGVYTYEIAIPLWEDWRTGEPRVKQALSLNDVVYVYAVMEDKIEGGNGTDLSYVGNPNFGAGAFDKAAILTLVLPGDVNGDGTVNGADLAIVLSALDAKPTDGNWDARADQDGDGEITSTDVSTVLTYMP